MVARVIHSYPIFLIGTVFGLFFFILAVNEKIVQIYNERDLLKIFQQKQQLEIQHAQELSKIALNLAHDIRSPIAALSILGPTLKASSGAETLILRTAIDRIHHVADTLLTRYRGSQTNEESKNENLDQKSTELLTHIIEPILIEKRYQNKNNPKIKLDLKLSQDSY